MMNPIFPLVSVVIPCRNEEQTIRNCILSLHAQTYPSECIEIIVADGMSTDNTRTILAEMQQRNPAIRVVNNSKLIAPAAMNRAIEVAKGKYIALLGAHSELSDNYIAVAVQLLEDQQVDCVGGVVNAISATSAAEAIALAISSPFGVGDAKFRYSNKEELVDTVAFGVYRLDIFQRIGLFDEDLPRNEDDEFNYRLRSRGGKILLSPNISARYYSRSTLPRLWHQYFGYGHGKVMVAKRHPEMMRARHFIPALFVASTVTLFVMAQLVRAARLMWVLLVSAYCVAACLASWRIAARHGWQHLLRLPIVFFVLHTSYGFGTLKGLQEQVFHVLKRS
jgi:glycosyltransferase involved in cell wall biosynthesis